MSHKKKYESKLGAKGLITAPNFLAEFILLRHAKSRKNSVPQRIWDKKFKKDLRWKYWHSLYHGEMTRAAKLLKDFELKDVLTALNTDEGKVILSLSNNKIRRLTKQAQTQRELAEQTKEKVELNVVSGDTLPRRTNTKKSKLGKLR
jgi:hypothetical protein